MPTLANPRHEAFAQAVASGLTATSAYTQVYGSKVKSPATCASHLQRRNPQVNARIAELQGTSAQGVVMTLREKLEYLTRVVLTPVHQVDDWSPLCQRVKTHGDTREFWMVDKLRALALLARLGGDFIPAPPEAKPTISLQEIAEAVRQSPVLRALSAQASLQTPAIPQKHE